MKKILIGGVSVFAIVAATNALAAGYTCEDLIEYTSCNDGLTLSNGQCVENATSCDAGYYLTGPCPDGYIYRTNVCDTTIDGDQVSWGMSEEECLYSEESDGLHPTNYTYHDALCIDTDNVYDTFADVINGLKEPTAITCAAAPAGSYATGGTATSATKCAAGTYQPATGQSSCVSAEKGYYVVGTGATAQSACPATGLTDKDGKTVVATTPSTGSTALSDCNIGSDVFFTDDKGVYHFTSNCAFDFYVASTDGTCPDGYAYITSRTEEGSLGDYEDPLGGEGCYRLPDDATDPETCEYIFNYDYNTGTVYCDGGDLEVQF